MQYFKYQNVRLSLPDRRFDTWVKVSAKLLNHIKYSKSQLAVLYNEVSLKL